MSFIAGEVDAVVVGAGHAGCEAALAMARMGMETLCLTLNMDSVAMMPCNPSIGGTAKGHLVREVDALGGEMGRAIDDTYIQSKMLNTGKGPAVHSLRAQADKKAYQRRMLRAMQNTSHLTLRQGEVSQIHTENGKITGVETLSGAHYLCRAVLIASGVYLQSNIIIGQTQVRQGPSGLAGAEHLSGALAKLGFVLRRFKTGTPARIDGRSIDFSQFEVQKGDDPVVPFSFLSGDISRTQADCYLGYTTPLTHEIIKENLHRAPMYSGAVKGIGARYCPSIEDKVVRFADRLRHPLFLEPEGLDCNEWYVQGMSTSMPEEVQIAIYRSIPGLEKAELTRLAYAIEYDCIDPTCLRPTLESKTIQGLYFAGQINGSSGYEEAAAQGLYAGMNCALCLQDRPPMLLTRADAYIGVLVDDLTLKGTNEPYRMMTSRAEYRLLLRQDNADLRLTRMGYDAGLASAQRLERMMEKKWGTCVLIEQLRTLRLSQAQAALVLGHDVDAPSIGISAYELLKRPQVGFADLVRALPTLSSIPGPIAEQTEISIRYAGYLARQEAQVEEFKRADNTLLPADLNYAAITGLRIEARQKLTTHKPTTLGAASRISGVSPGDITVLMIKLAQLRREEQP